MATGRINQIADVCNDISRSPKTAEKHEHDRLWFFTGSTSGKQPTTFPSVRKDSQHVRVIRTESKVQRETTRSCQHQDPKTKSPLQVRKPAVSNRRSLRNSPILGKSARTHGKTSHRNRVAAPHAQSRGKSLKGAPPKLRQHSNTEFFAQSSSFHPATSNSPHFPTDFAQCLYTLKNGRQVRWRVVRYLMGDPPNF